MHVLLGLGVKEEAPSSARCHYRIAAQHRIRLSSSLVQIHFPPNQTESRLFTLSSHQYAAVVERGLGAEEVVAVGVVHIPEEDQLLLQLRPVRVLGVSKCTEGLGAEPGL